MNLKLFSIIGLFIVALLSLELAAPLWVDRAADGAVAFGENMRISLYRQNITSEGKGKTFLGKAWVALKARDLEAKNKALKEHVKKYGSKNKGPFLAFSKAWFEKNQGALLFLCNTPGLKYWFRSVMGIAHDLAFTEDIYWIGPNYYTVRIGNEEFRSDFRTHPKFAKRVYYAFKPLWWLMHGWDWLIGDRIVVAAPRPAMMTPPMPPMMLRPLSFGFATLTAYPDPHIEVTTVDGSTKNQNANYTTCHNAATGTDSFDTGGAESIINNIDYYTGDSIIYRTYALFSTSALTSSATISAAVLSLYGSSKAQTDSGQSNVHIVATTPASNTVIVKEDFSRIGSTSFASVTYTNFQVVYNAFTLDANGIANVSKTDISKFGARISGDMNSSVPTDANYIIFLSADNAGTSNDPKLVVTYTAAAATAPVKAYFGGGAVISGMGM